MISDSKETIVTNGGRSCDLDELIVASNHNWFKHMVHSEQQWLMNSVQ